MSDNFSDHFSTSLYTPINVWQNKKSNQHTHTQKNKKPAPIFFLCEKKLCQSLLPRKKKTSSRPSLRLDATSIGINFIQKSWVPPVFHLSLVYPSGPRRFWGYFFFGGEKERWELEESWERGVFGFGFVFFSNSCFLGYVFCFVSFMLDWDLSFWIWSFGMRVDYCMFFLSGFR